MCVCVYHCAKLLYTIQHKIVLIIFSPNLQTITTAQMLSTGCTRSQCQTTAEEEVMTGRKEAMKLLPNKQQRGHHKATKEDGNQRTPGRETCG